MCYTFIFINFFVGFISDLVLNILSRIKYSPPSIRSLYTYFKHYDSAILTAIYAGLTVISVLIPVMILSYIIFGFATPTNKTQLLKLILLSIPFGYFADVIIYKYHIFGNTLDPFYEIAGAGFWGAMSLIFSIVVSWHYMVYVN
jgi:hypothetical protein